MDYRVIGLMSGTSLDGLDIAFCSFSPGDDRWSFSIECAETIPYPDHWKHILSTLESASALDFVTADIEYGHLLGSLTRGFIERHNIRPGFIASHGHTIFHQPDKRLTCQIGRGSAIAAETGLQVVYDFRSLDVALGGQGAPLVPAGDRLLFGDFGYCLNLGGFANISYDKGDSRIAYDICPANIVLNHLASGTGHEYDEGGRLAETGKVNPRLLGKLNALPYYNQPFPKSLGKEWVLEHIHPLLKSRELPVNDLLATFSEHVALQVSKAVQERDSKMLITGGGAFNSHLVNRIRQHAGSEIIIPDDLTINFKEALVFAFLGVLRMRNEINCLKSVTGARAGSSGGSICRPF
ncbi:MAG: anhydro-N-acetylmuramic acid kinase [Bacteroidota bacterium]